MIFISFQLRVDSGGKGTTKNVTIRQNDGIIILILQFSLKKALNVTYWLVISNFYRTFAV